MTPERSIMRDPPATRRLRRLAPLVALLALIALVMAPGIIAEIGERAATGSAAPEALSQRVTPSPLPAARHREGAEPDQRSLHRRSAS